MGRLLAHYTLTLVILMVSLVESSSPLFNDGWTPVRKSQVVELPPQAFQTSSKQRQSLEDEKRAKEVDEAEDRIQIVDLDGPESEDYSHDEESNEKVERFQQNQQQRERNAQKYQEQIRQRPTKYVTSEVGKEDKEEKEPLIVYPEGTYSNQQQKQQRPQQHQRPQPRPQQIGPQLRPQHQNPPHQRPRPRPRPRPVPQPQHPRSPPPQHRPQPGSNPRPIQLVPAHQRPPQQYPSSRQPLVRDQDSSSRPDSNPGTSLLGTLFNPLRQRRPRPPPPPPPPHTPPHTPNPNEITQRQKQANSSERRSEGITPIEYRPEKTDFIQPKGDSEFTSQLEQGPNLEEGNNDPQPSRKPQIPPQRNASGPPKPHLQGQPPHGTPQRYPGPPQHQQKNKQTESPHQNEQPTQQTQRSSVQQDQRKIPNSNQQQHSQRVPQRPQRRPEIRPQPISPQPHNQQTGPQQQPSHQSLPDNEGQQQPKQQRPQRPLQSPQRPPLPPPPPQGPLRQPRPPLTEPRNAQTRDGHLPPPHPRPHRPNSQRPPQRPGLIQSIGSSISNIGSNIKCKAEDFAADVRLNDRDYMQSQIRCVLNEGPCDEVGATIKRMAPDIMRGLCPRPCNECTKKQIQKIMGIMSQRYPEEWSKMIKQFTG